MAWPVRAAIKILHLKAALLFQKLLPGSNRPGAALLGIGKEIERISPAIRIVTSIAGAIKQSPLIEISHFPPKRRFPKSQRRVQVLSDTPRSHRREWGNRSDSLSGDWKYQVRTHHHRKLKVQFERYPGTEQKWWVIKP
ncbi:hypothetical protein TNCV_775611 [Trichonephila clavipes]|nr:hypothetical protein TNCV_775611 [Trichonephila clavipes]